MTKVVLGTDGTVDGVGEGCGVGDSDSVDEPLRAAKPTLDASASYTA